MDAQNKAREKRYLKKYGITLAEYDAMLMEHDGCCKICRRVPTGMPLHVEHDHKLLKLKCRAIKSVAGEWAAMVDSFSNVFPGQTKSLAVKAARLWLLRRSIRGLVCWFCNGGLKSFFDKPELLRRAADYLDNYRDRLYNRGEAGGSPFLEVPMLQSGTDGRR